MTRRTGISPECEVIGIEGVVEIGDGRERGGKFEERDVEQEGEMTEPCGVPLAGVGKGSD